ncbi:MAG: ribosome silencing factor [Saccharofermentanales bacterium]
MATNHHDPSDVTPDLSLAAEAEEQQKLEELDRIAETVVEALEDKKGQDIDVLKVTPKTTLADVFIIASGTSRIHIKTLAESVEEAVMRRHGLEPHHIEGVDTRNWVLLDYVDFVVHLMLPEDREYYHLERLWQSNRDRRPI